MRRLTLLVIVFIFAACFSLNVHADDGSAQWFRYVNGNVINDMVYYSGAVWCATTNGIVRCNPETSDLFTFGADRGVPDIACSSITVDADGVLWAISGGRLIRYEDLRWHTVEPGNDDFGGQNISFGMIEPDPERGLWIATGSGVVRYDGESWRLYSDADGLPYVNVRSVSVAPDGRVWAGTVSPAVWKTAADSPNEGASGAAGKPAGDPSYNSAIAVFENGSWRTFRDMPPTSLSGDLSVAAGSNGTIAAWRETGYPSISEGLHWFDGQSSWYILNTDHGIPSKGILSAEISPDGTWWIGTTGGLGRLRVSNDIVFDTFTAADGLPSDNVSAITFSPEGTLFVGTNHGLARWDTAAWATYSIPSIAGSYVKHIAEDASGSLWFGTDNGLSCFDDGVWTTYTVADGLPGDYINGLKTDSRGRLWVATTGGVALRDGARWKTFDINLEYTDVANIWTDDRDRLWVISSGLDRIDGERADVISRYRVWSVAHDTDGTFWAIILTNGVKTDLYHYADEELRFVRTLVNDGVNVTDMTARNGVLWAVTYKQAMRLDGESLTTYTAADGFPEFPVRVAFDPDGRLWCWSESKLTCFENGAWRTFGAADGITGSIVGAYLDHPGRAWFVTKTNEVYSYEDGGFVRLIAATDLPGRLHHHMTDRQGRLWLAAGTSMYVYDGAELQQYAIPFDAVPWSYGFFTDDSAGRIWYSTLAGGVVRLDPDGRGVAEARPQPESIACRSYPNPFNPATTIRFTLPHASDVTLDIYNAAGQKIRTLATGRMEAGEHNVRWNGLLDSGMSAASGVYIARLRAGNTVGTGRMVLVR